MIEVFNTASKFQAKQEKDSVAVVVLDEVGLAEDSPNLPLKALHPLLEDGTEGTKRDFTDQVFFTRMYGFRNLVKLSKLTLVKNTSFGAII